MAQQTINIGASPNDGTGTPLRTAFQYTNSNFSELYTAVGPSGNNIVVPGSATITGDLTVRTNVISATSSGVGFGINTAAAAIDVVSSFQWRSNTGGTDKLAIFSGGAGLIYLGSTTASALSFLYNGSEAMRLNSTGLGVGASPSFKLDVQGSGATIARLKGGSGSNQGSAYFVTRAGSASSLLAIGDYSTIGGGTPDQAASIYTDVNIPLRFDVGGSLKATIDTSGNVGIGVTPSAGGSIYYKTLEIGKAGCGLFTATAVLTGSELTYLSGNGVLAYNSGPEWKYGNNGAAAIYGIEDGVHKWYNATTGTAGVVFTPTQAMTLDASGNLLVGVTSTTTPGVGNTTEGASIRSTGDAFFSHATSQALYLNTNLDGQIVSIRRSNVAVGSISVTTTATAYNTSSDYRLKEAVQPLVGGLARVSALKPSIYKWKADGSNGEGFLAHELAEVVPLAVTGEKDTVNEDGSIKAQGVDLSKVVPILVAAIQELTARVQTLETR